jgi:hypothetical protein
MASPAQRHVLVIVINLLAIVECFAWAVACAYNLAFRAGDPFGAPAAPDRVTQNTVVAVFVVVMLIVNLVATAAFILRNHGLGLPLLAVIQVANVVATIVLLNVQLSNSWSMALMLSAGPVFTLILLGVLWRVTPPLNRPVDGA